TELDDTMTKYTNITPEGMEDILFSDCEARRAIESSVIGLFKSRGFSEVITPTLEFYDVFSNRFNAIPQEMMYKLFDGKGRILALRSDNTMPIARLAATRLKAFAPPLRLYYNQRVFRISPSMTGRSDEFTQCGIELIGSNGLKADLEVIDTAITALLGTVGENFRIELGHVGFYKAIVDNLPLGPEKTEQLQSFIEAKNYAALHDLLAPSAQGSACCRALMVLPRLFGGGEVFEQALAVAPNEASSRAICYLSGLYDELCAMGLRDHILIDFGLVSQIDYYSGVVFRGFVQGSGETILSGGRYDSLLSAFGADLPATGFAVNVDAVAKAVEYTGLKRETVLLHYEKGYEKAAFERREQLIASGTVCEMSVFETEEEAESYARLRGMSRLDSIGAQHRIREL
ncbi:MAG: ATP phosphoribosyltransferase regulatory subunit, partial [Clostridia bacterium]|nr:ATP phosphoribosyltransferase regulatory subunit [Clostridia bacterium]